MTELNQARRRETEKRKDAQRKASASPPQRLKVVKTFFSRLERNPPRCGPRPEHDGPEPGLMRMAGPTMMQTCTAG